MDRCFWADGYSDDGDDTELSSAQLTDLWESFFFFFLAQMELCFVNPTCLV